MPEMKLAVVGTGYVGLVAGTCFSELGNQVICVDIDEEKIKKLNSGKVPIFEPGLKPLIDKNVKARRLFFSTDLREAVEKSDIIFIAVGTPPKRNGEADLSYVENVARQIALYATKPKIIVEKSTVPVETGERIAKILKQYNPHNLNFDVVSNPEFLREGSAIEDFMKPDRIVIGTNSKKAAEIMKKLYKPFNAPIIVTDIKSAEIIKHASNSFLATKISFINAVATICELTGADIEKVAQGMGLDKRIGKNFLNAGIGYGGSCFPKDVDAFIRIASQHGFNFTLLEEVQKINKLQRKKFVKKIEDVMWVLKDKKIAVLGLAFKPNTDDLREAPAIDIIKALQREGAKISVFDPKAMENAKKLLKEVEFCKNAYEAINGADALVFVTEWPEFKKLDLKKVKHLLNTPLVFDGRNIFEPKKMAKYGFNYISVGR